MRIAPNYDTPELRLAASVSGKLNGEQAHASVGMAPGPYERGHGSHPNSSLGTSVAVGPRGRGAGSRCWRSWRGFGGLG